ncbi:hypothetical protein [uncultured Stenotrophomonas sp.]|uniref:hypothetical protein n=1 Tax=uncultured Stenotrophomonas sp. TaxID=165438 RepID=UPI0025CD3B46|nr:hypothetical protein [uncultured Stenotrophomonas sp.]
MLLAMDQEAVAARFRFLLLAFAFAPALRSFIRHTDPAPVVIGLRAVIHMFIPNRSTKIVDNLLPLNRQMWRFFNHPAKRLMPQGLDRDIHSLAHAASTSAVENPEPLSAPLVVRQPQGYPSKAQGTASPASNCQ